jgi:hypothetical protein
MAGIMDVPPTTTGCPQCKLAIEKRERDLGLIDVSDFGHPIPQVANTYP